MGVAEKRPRAGRCSYPSSTGVNVAFLGNVDGPGLVVVKVSVAAVDWEVCVGQGPALPVERVAVVVLASFKPVPPDMYLFVFLYFFVGFLSGGYKEQSSILADQ
jgi:hypothetical protein